MHDYIGYVGSTPPVTEMTFSILGQDISFVWDAAKSEWVSKELEAYKADESYRARIHEGRGWLFGLACGVVVGVGFGVLATKLYFNV